jgi:hypothetical protein
MSDNPDDYDDDDGDSYEDDPDEWFLENICGMGPNGQCSLAGSEECDWECPRMR